MKQKSMLYGEYEMTKVCKFTFFLPASSYKNFTPEELTKQRKKLLNWLKIFHPKFYFNSMSLESTRKDLPEYSNAGHSSQQTEPFFLYLPIIENNKDWAKNNPDCPYLQQNKKEKILPIGVSQKKVDHWIMKAMEADVLIKQY